MSGRVPRKNHNFVCVPGETKVVSVVKSFCASQLLRLPCTTKVVSVVKSFCASHLLRLSRTMETAEAFESEFRTLVDELRKGGEGWEVRQEPPSGAYLHVSLPQWGDEDMNGIHIETYVLGRELAARSAPVALHCESGCPFQRQFMKLFHERAAAHTEAWPGNYTMQVVNSSTACEISVPFASTPKETVQKLLTEIRRLQQLAPIVDGIIKDCTQAESA